MAEMHYRLDIRNCRNHTDLIAAIAPCNSVYPGDVVELDIDLRADRDFVFADMLLLLTCLVCDLRSMGVSIHGQIAANWNGNSVRYASRINFFSLIGLNIPEDFIRHSSQGRFMEIT